jgi:hypothetical protein
VLSVPAAPGLFSDDPGKAIRKKKRTNKRGRDFGIETGRFTRYFCALTRESLIILPLF